MRTSLEKRSRLRRIAVRLALSLGFALPALAQDAAPPAVTEEETPPDPVAHPAIPARPAPRRHPLLSAAHADREIALSFREAPLEQVAALYGELTNRVLIEAPGLKAAVTLRSNGRLSATEALEAIETALALQQIALVPVGETFLKAVPLAGAAQEGLAVGLARPSAPFDESDRVASQVFVLRHIDYTEAQPVLQSILRAQGRIQPLDRINGLIVTDTSLNLKRASEILDFLDQPMESRVETRVYELAYAKARDVAGRLGELIQDSQAGARARPTPTAPATPAPTPTPAPTTPPGVIRAPPRPTTATVGETSGAERGLLQGRVKIVADERSNVLIVVSLPENFIFFDRIVAVLDRPVEPGVIFKVRPLEYAKAEEVAQLLTSLVGAAAAKSDAPPARGAPAAGEEGRSRPLEEVAQRSPTEAAAELLAAAQNRLGALSANTKILADKRTNMLLLMGSRPDVNALEEVIAQIDVATAQVLIEAVIIEVRLSKNVEYGIDWLQRSLSVYQARQSGPQGGVSVAQPLMAFGGGQRFSDTAFRDGATIGRNNPALGVGGLSYYTTIYGLNMDVILRIAAASSDARILSTPVVQTTDNTEAKIIVGEERPVVTSTSLSTAGQQTTSYQYRNIGLELAVTPRINPERVVVMEVTQTADNLGGFETIDGNRVPVITKRQVKASIVAPNRSTIVLGGLVNNDRRLARSKVPLLGDIPLLGLLFRSDRWEDNRTELLVMLTPYVLVSPEEARKEARRLYEAGSASRAGWERGWTDSELAAPPREGTRAGFAPPRVTVMRRAAETPSPAPASGDVTPNGGATVEIKTVPESGAEAPR